MIAATPFLLWAVGVVAGCDVPSEVETWLLDRARSSLAPSRIISQDEGARVPRVVIVGRAFAGTSELAQFEGSIVALARPVDVLALDVGSKEGHDLDGWLQAGKGGLDALQDELGPLAWSRAETRAWLEALRAREAKPRVVGIGVGDPREACTEVVAFVGKVLPKMRARAELVLLPLSLEGRNGLPRYFALGDNERAILRIGLDELVDVVRASEEDIARLATPAEARRGQRALLQLQQYENQMRFVRDGDEHDPRGRILAENALAALREAGDGARLFALAELRDLARKSDPDSFAAQLVTLGGERATCIATACDRGTFLALDPNAGAAAGSPRQLTLASEGASELEQALKRAGGENAWVLDLRAQPAGAVAAWLGAQRSLRSARRVCGAPSETPWEHDILGDFDALAWFPTVHVSASGSALPR